MLNALTINEYEPNPAEHLLAAFRVLDPENKGYVNIDIITELLTTKGIPFRDREIKNFRTFAEDNKGERVYYEDYV